MIYLDNQLVVHWGKVPLPDGLLGPDVPGFQQGSLLELVVSVNHLGTSPASGMVMGSHMSHHGKLGQVSTSRQFCALSVCGSVFSLSGQCTPSGSHHMGPCRSLLPVGLMVTA